MRVVSWNCRKGDFSSKFKLICRLKPDIVVVPESNDAEVGGANKIWAPIKQGKSYGLGLYAFNGYVLRPIAKPILENGVYVPAKIIRNGEFICNLLGVWSREDSGGSYVKPTIAALNKFSRLIRSGKTIVAGDFNSHAQWLSHSLLLNRTEELGLVSAYHRRYRKEHGDEGEATFFQYFKKSHSIDNDPYHIDYVYIPHDWGKLVRTVKVGSHSTLKNGRPVGSDHLPLIVDFKI
jgi:hypothetical protein